MSDTELATVLEEAADLLLIHGRCRGKGIDDNGRMCVRGAILAVEGDDPAQVMGTISPAVRALELHLGAHPEIHADRYIAALAPEARGYWLHNTSGRWPAWIWNDDSSTTDDEVRDVLLLAAKDLRNEAV